MGSSTSLLYVKNGTATTVQSSGGTFFAVPAGDYNGAWMIQRNPSLSTILWSHTPSAGLVKRWEDVTAPEVEALIAAKSNTKVLIQVHRSRVTLDQLGFKDPALAVWHAGDPAPRGGGRDGVRECGGVRASRAQRLVLPGAARTAGAFGSFWQTDVTFYNPSDQPQTVQVHYAANGNTLAIAADNTRTVSLAPFEIRTIPDVLKNLFLFESGSGALYIVPAPGTGGNVTRRTYAQAANGTFGFGMNAIDVFAAASPRFPVSFSGARSEARRVGD